MEEVLEWDWGWALQGRLLPKCGVGSEEERVSLSQRPNFPG